MSAVNRLRARLKNVSKDVVEYRIALSEAKQLLKEVEILLDEIERLKQKPPEVVVNAPAVITRIIDGGHL
jgi:hypothetical protein